MTKKILVVDDEENILISLEFLLQRAGYDVAVAHDGDEALTQAERFAPDLILLDVMMPKKDGYEVCRLLRQDPRHEACKIVLLTAKGRDIDRAKGLAQGADDYLTKPFSTKELLEHVERLLAPGTV